MNIEELKQKQIERLKELGDYHEVSNGYDEYIQPSEKDLENFLQSCQQEIIDKVKEEIEKLKPQQTSNLITWKTIFKQGYNQAIEDILNKLK